MKKETFRVTATENKELKTLDVIFEGDLSLKNANAIKRSMGSLKITSGTVKLKLKNVDKIDLTTIQTLRAYRKYLTGEGKSITTEAVYSNDTERLLKNAGFDNSL